MLIPTKSSFTKDNLCPSKLLNPRSFTSDVVSTANSFKHWNTCMDNKTCKIVAIVGIVIAIIVLIWIIGGLARCLCQGITGICEMFCCCFTCCCNGRERPPRTYGYQREMSDIPKQTVYDNPNMYPPKPQPVYDNSAWNQGGYRPVNTGYGGGYGGGGGGGGSAAQYYGPGVVSDEDKYDYHNHGYRGNNY